MNERQAEKIADIFGGETWQSGGDIWLVLIRRNDGHIVVISDEVICEYQDEASFDNSDPSVSILLS